jgi:acetyl esterase/lipase
MGEKGITMTIMTYSYKRIGIHEIHADVYTPEAVAGAPAVLWLHGGGLIFGSRKDLISPRVGYVQRYLALGFVVVAVDYRLAPETKLDAIVEDVKDAYRWVRDIGPQLLGIDAERVAIVGHSAGGYLALTAGEEFSPRPAAVISFYGYADITRPWYTLPSPHYSHEPPVPEEVAFAAVGTDPISEPPAENARELFYLYCRQHGLWPTEVTGHDPSRNPEWFDRFCPIRNIDKDYPPVLLVHGDCDTDVPCDESVRMAEALAQRKLPHELIVIPGGQHGFDELQRDDPNVIAAMDRATVFLKANLADSVEYGRNH